MRVRRFLAAMVIGLLAAAAVNAENWPAWRGPTGDGRSPESGLPTRWSASDNVTWQVALPGPGNSTPIVWDDRVFLTQATEDGRQRWLICFDRRDGRERWRSGVRYEMPELTHETNPFCSASPATDGERVLAFFGSAGLVCYDLDGKELWKRDLGTLRHIWGHGASPVLAGDSVFLNVGPGENTTLVCLDKKSGAVRWQHRETGGASGEPQGSVPGRWLGSWGDPLIRRVGERDELFMAYPGRVAAFDPASGRELWTCGGLTPLFYTSPLFENGTVVAMGGYNGMAAAVRAGGSGDVTATHRLWTAEKTRQRIGSGVIHQGHVYILTDPGIAECRDLATGAMVWEERLKGPGPTAQNWSSLVLSADGLCYAVNQGGDGFVFRASPTFELIATNPTGEKTIGSIAASDGQLFLRSHRTLRCIGVRRAEAAATPVATAAKLPPLTLVRDGHWLVVKTPGRPAPEIRINYLEAYCRAGSTDADWVTHTVIPHRSEVVDSPADGRSLRLRDLVADGLRVEHSIVAGDDDVTFTIVAENPTDKVSEAHWAQPCIRLGAFTGFDDAGKDLDDYLGKCFVFRDGVLALFPTADWAKTARYTPGQVWGPPEVPRSDLNPRPLAGWFPSERLIGCFSGDEKWLFAVAAEPLQELFQGVARCLHADFRLGGLKPGQRLTVKKKIYVLPNDVPALLRRFHADFPPTR